MVREVLTFVGFGLAGRGCPPDNKRIKFNWALASEECGARSLVPQLNRISAAEC
jgi:hypothetical protein